MKIMKKISKNKTKELTTLSREVRKNILKMVTASKSSHVGSAFSIVEILVVLYKLIIKNNSLKPEDKLRDRFLLSKGHACSALYSILAELGYFDKESLKSFSTDDSILMAHVNSDVPGVEFSTGSLGHALPVGLGMALASKTKGEKWKTFVLLSDGELNEGSNWEAFLTAAHLKLDNLCVVVDCNNIQGLGLTKDIIRMEPLDDKFQAFGWSVRRANGHNFEDIYSSITSLFEENLATPKILIADTIKGKGISFMENKTAWHYNSPSADEYEKGISELMI